MAGSAASDEGRIEREDQVVEVFWAPGSTASLRLKEFVEKSGVPHQMVNLAENSERMLELRAHGFDSSAVRLGSRYVIGSNLEEVAALIGAVYTPPTILDPDALVAKFGVITAALRRLTTQITPDVALKKSHDRGRTAIGLAYHASSVVRVFLRDVDPESWDSDDYYAAMHESRGACDEVGAPDVVLERLDDTASRLSKWWNDVDDGDSMNRLVSVYWGDHTLHEALERETWHMAHHTRQLAALIRECGIEPDGPLSASDLAGLPLPEALYS